MPLGSLNLIRHLSLAFAPAKRSSGQCVFLGFLHLKSDVTCSFRLAEPQESTRPPGGFLVAGGSCHAHLKQAPWTFWAIHGQRYPVMSCESCYRTPETPATWLPLRGSVSRAKCQAWASWPHFHHHHPGKACVVDLNCSLAHLPQLRSEYIQKRNFLFLLCKLDLNEASFFFKHYCFYAHAGIPMMLPEPQGTLALNPVRPPGWWSPRAGPAPSLSLCCILSPQAAPRSGLARETDFVNLRLLAS